MSVKIRMMRLGRRHRPFFRINAVDSRVPRNGRILEKLGHYDPVEKDESKQIVLDLEKVKAWLDKGAVPSETIDNMLGKLGIETKFAIERKKRREKAKAIAKAKGKPFDTAQRVAVTKAAEDAAAKVEAEAKAKEEEAKAKAAAAEAAAKAKEEEAKAKAEAAEAAAKAKEEEAAAKAAEAEAAPEAAEEEKTEEAGE